MLALRALPPMMQVMKDIGGVEIPEILSTLDDARETEENNSKPDASPVTVATE